MRTSIEKFSEDNNAFARDFGAHLQIIRRYDEVLSDKASKHALYESEVRLNESYKPQFKELDVRILSNLELIK